MNTENCLRPEFTAALASRLLNGESIKLISPHGRGRRQTIADLTTILPDAVFIIHMNMRDYALDYKSFFDELVRLSEIRASSVGELLDKLDSSNRQSLFILHNFDEIRNPDAVNGGYSAELFSGLNSIAQRTHISLLCVCETEQQFFLIAADGKPVRSSGLNATALELPPLP